MSLKISQRAKDEIRGTIIAVAIALIIRTFLFQPFTIPSGSMYPTLMIGDFLFASKYPYGYSSKSFIFGFPPFKGRIMSGEPKLGEVVIFNNPKQSHMDFIKRCVGLPGDKVQMKEGYLHINGQKCELEYVGMYTYTDQYGRTEVCKQYIETLPSGLKHSILKKYEFGQASHDNTQEYVVPEGHYFMMGDNRDNSQDSRFLDKVGYIPLDSLIGRAELLFFSTEARLYKHAESKWYDITDMQFDPISWVTGVRLDRFFKLIR